MRQGNCNPGHKSVTHESVCWDKKIHGIRRNRQRLTVEECSLSTGILMSYFSLLLLPYYVAEDNRKEKLVCSVCKGAERANFYCSLKSFRRR